MKKIIILLIFFFLFLISLNLKSQTKSLGIQQKTYAVVDYTNWQLSNQGCYGCSSFYWKITKSVYSDENGYYTYDFWFYSNSLYTQGQWASTYVFDIYIKVDGYWINTQPFWVTFKEQYNPTMMRFESINETPFVNIIWGGHRLL